MKQVDPLLKSLLSSGNQFYYTELYTIKIMDIPTPITLTSLDIDVSVDGVLYKSAPISRGSITESVGIDVEDLTVDWNIKKTDTIPGGTLPILHAMRYGVFDGATLQLDKLFSPIPWSYDMGDISSKYVLSKRFKGLMDISSAGILSANIKVESYTKLLNVKMPRNIFTASCGRAFYSADCGVNRANLTVKGNIMGGNTHFVNTNLPFSEDFYNLGVITFTSGVNIGVRRSIRKSSNGVIYPILPFPLNPNPGDDFIVYPGCPKTRVACNSYNNSSNFKGFPYIPIPEISLGAS